MGILFEIKSPYLILAAFSATKTIGLLDGKGLPPRLPRRTSCKKHTPYIIKNPLHINLCRHSQQILVLFQHRIYYILKECLYLYTGAARILGWIHSLLQFFFA